MKDNSELNPIVLFLAICGGAHPTAITRATSQADTYAWIGVGIILITLFGGVSGGYALFTVLENTLVSCFGGTGFGLALGFLDRSIVSSIRKEEDPKLADRIVNSGTSVIKILLSGLISFIVSTPLQTKIFETSINAKIDDINRSKLAETQKQIDKELEEDQLLVQLEKNKNDTNKIIEEEKAKRDKNENIFTQELKEGNSSVGRGGGDGAVAKRFKELLEEQEKKLAKEKKKLSEIERQIEERKKEINEKKEKQKEVLENQDDILVKLRAFREIQKEDNEKNPVIFGMGYTTIASLGITLFFVALDGTTITVKLFSKRNSYDEALDELEEENKSYIAAVKKEVKDIETKRAKDEKQIEIQILSDYQEYRKKQIKDYKDLRLEELKADREIKDKLINRNKQYRQAAIDRLDDLFNDQDFSKKLGTQQQDLNKINRLAEIAENGFFLQLIQQKVSNIGV